MMRPAVQPPPWWRRSARFEGLPSSTFGVSVVAGATVGRSTYFGAAVAGAATVGAAGATGAAATGGAGGAGAATTGAGATGPGADWVTAGGGASAITWAGVGGSGAASGAWLPEAARLRLRDWPAWADAETRSSAAIRTVLRM